MILSEQKHSYILVSVFAGGVGSWAGGLRQGETDKRTKKDIFIEINSENSVDKLI